MFTRKSIGVLIAVAALLAALPALAERASDADRVSKNGKATGSIGSLEVTLEYGRPNVKSRTIWGGLVPYGEVWRTGADEATTITFSCDAQVGDMIVPAGSYSLFTVPGADGWEFVINRVAKQWGAYKYDPSQDVVRVGATPRSSEHTESLELAVEGSQVVLRWETLEVGFTVEEGC